MSNIIPHKPLREGDLDDEFLNYIIQAYYNDELREDNYEEFALHLNNMLKRKKENDDKEFIESTRKLFKAVSTLNIEEKEEENN